MQDVKENCLRIQGDTYIENQNNKDGIKFTLPDGNTLTLDAKQRQLYPEQIFSYQKNTQQI